MHIDAVKAATGSSTPYGARADEQHWWLMANDDRGVYGEYPLASPQVIGSGR